MHFSGDDVPPDGSEHGSRRPSISGRSGSGSRSSSRSTSFSLPPETIGKEFRGAHDVGGEVEFEEEMDEESTQPYKHENELYA
jgi:protein phosphatase inhibitor 2